MTGSAIMFPLVIGECPFKVFKLICSRLIIKYRTVHCKSFEVKNFRGMDVFHRKT